MPDTDAPKDFPFVTMGVTLLGLFLFIGLVMVAYYSPNYLGGTRIEPKADPALKLKEAQARNQAVLDGTDPSGKLSVVKAAAEVVAFTEKSKGDKDRYGRLPFPVEPPGTPGPAEKK